MSRNVDRAIHEALALATQRGASIARVTFTARDPCDDLVDRVRSALARHGLVDTEVILERRDAPLRLVALELRRS